MAGALPDEVMLPPMPTRPGSWPGSPGAGPSRPGGLVVPAGGAVGAVGADSAAERSARRPAGDTRRSAGSGGSGLGGFGGTTGGGVGGGRRISLGEAAGIWAETPPGARSHVAATDVGAASIQVHIERACAISDVPLANNVGCDSALPAAGMHLTVGCSRWSQCRHRRNADVRII